jgi:hypothetical protein
MVMPQRDRGIPRRSRRAALHRCVEGTLPPQYWICAHHMSATMITHSDAGLLETFPPLFDGSCGQSCKAPLTRVLTQADQSCRKVYNYRSMWV